MAEEVEGRTLAVSWSAAPDLWLLRLRRDRPAARLRAAAVLDLDLPEEIGATRGGSLCVAPGEWLVERDCDGLEPMLLAAMTDEPAALVSLGPGAERLEIVGEQAADLLNKGCSLDLHCSMFPAGRCTRTLLAGVGVTLVRLGDEAFRLYVERSVSEWARDWLDEAAREFRNEGISA
ncbi:MAG: sarcosine oxidase subunit gamma [Allosphingosinicella sp.]|uniref:sarcosine oxidase subunit gamma n=1 Tax=Allosphingosinicella sp. TaxID=2823234 RepID=UPI0039458767